MVLRNRSGGRGMRTSQLKNVLRSGPPLWAAGRSPLGPSGLDSVPSECAYRSHMGHLFPQTPRLASLQERLRAPPPPVTPETAAEQRSGRRRGVSLRQVPSSYCACPLLLWQQRAERRVKRLEGGAQGGLQHNTSPLKPLIIL